MQFAGWALSAGFLPRMADIYGRRPIYMYSMIAHMAIYGAIILSRNLYLTIVLMFFLGMTSVARGAIGYLYTLEFIP